MRSSSAISARPAAVSVSRFVRRSAPGCLVDEAIALKRPQQAREVAGVEPEPRADVTRRRAVGADLEQHARLAERAVAEVAVVERADLAGDEPVEAADGGDL